MSSCFHFLSVILYHHVTPLCAHLIPSITSYGIRSATFHCCPRFHCPFSIGRNTLTHNHICDTQTHSVFVVLTMSPYMLLHQHAPACFPITLLQIGELASTEVHISVVLCLVVLGFRVISSPYLLFFSMSALLCSSSKQSPYPQMQLQSLRHDEEVDYRTTATTTTATITTTTTMASLSTMLFIFKYPMTMLPTQ